MWTIYLFPVNSQIIVTYCVLGTYTIVNLVVILRLSAFFKDLHTIPNNDVKAGLAVLSCIF